MKNSIDIRQEENGNTFKVFIKPDLEPFFSHFPKELQVIIEKYSQIEKPPFYVSLDENAKVSFSFDVENIFFCLKYSLLRHRLSGIWSRKIGNGLGNGGAARHKFLFKKNSQETLQSKLHEKITLWLTREVKEKEYIFAFCFFFANFFKKTEKGKEIATETEISQAKRKQESKDQNATHLLECSCPSISQIFFLKKRKQTKKDI